MMRRRLFQLLAAGIMPLFTACSDAITPEIRAPEDRPTRSLDIVQTPRVMAGASHSCAARADGAIDCWGYAIPNIAGAAITSISGGESMTCYLQVGGEGVCAGPRGSEITSEFAALTLQSFDAGPGNACGVTTGGAAYCAGEDPTGQVNGVQSGTFTQVSAGYGEACAITSGESVACWGFYSLVPPGTGTYTQVTVGEGYACAVRNDGVVACWGNNDYGQAPATRTPASGTTFTKVVAGIYHTCALQSDGVVECFGSGNGSTHTATVGTFTDVDAGALHTCAMNSEQFVECWGDNEFGQAKSEQRLTGVTAPSDPAIGDTWDASTTSTSGLTVSVTAGPSHQCTATGGVVTFKAQGLCDVTLSQAGNGSFLGAPTEIISVNADGLQKPLSPSATAVSDAQVSVNWLDVSSRDTRYVVSRRVRNGDSYGPWQTIAEIAANSASYADTKVLAGVRYQYRIIACSENGCTLPALSGLVTPLTIPAAPGSAAATGSAGQISVTWTDVSASEVGFEIARRSNASGTWTGWALLDVAAANATSIVDASAADHILYQYRVRACNGRGCSDYSITGKASTGVRPSIVTALSATPISATQIDLTWADVSNETRYEVQRSQGTGVSWSSWSAAAQLAANTTAYPDAAAASGVEYRYRVRACTLVGCSGWSAAAFATTP